MARTPQPVGHKDNKSRAVHEPCLTPLLEDWIHQAQQVHNLHTALSRKLYAAKTIIAAVEGQLVSKNKDCDNLQDQLALQAQQCEHLQELVADALVEKQLLHESATRLQIECGEARNDLAAKSQECNRLQEMAAKLRVGNHLLDVSASRLQNEREETRIDLDSSRQENSQLLDNNISRLEASLETQASRIGKLQRRLADNKAKVSIRHKALEKSNNINKLSRKEQKGTRDDPIELDV